MRTTIRTARKILDPSVVVNYLKGVSVVGDEALFCTYPRRAVASSALRLIVLDIEVALVWSRMRLTASVAVAIELFARASHY